MSGIELTGNGTVDLFIGIIIGAFIGATLVGLYYWLIKSKRDQIN